MKDIRSQVARKLFALLGLSFMLAVLGGLFVPAFAQVPDIPSIRCPDGTVIANDGVADCPNDPGGGGGGSGSSSGATPASVAIALGAAGIVTGAIVAAAKHARARVPSPQHVPTYPNSSAPGGAQAAQQHVSGRGVYAWETPAPSPNLPPAQLIGDRAAIAQPNFTGNITEGLPDPSPAPNTTKDVKKVGADPAVALQNEIRSALHALEEMFSRGQIPQREYAMRREALRRSAGQSWTETAVEVAAGAGGAAAGYAVTNAATQRFCTACGRPRDGGASFCSACGKRFG